MILVHNIPLVHLAWQVVAWGLAVAWVGKAVTTAVGLRRVANLARPEFDRVPAGEPTIFVIVPGRNEAANIAACLESLLAQDCAGLRILAVDDRSTDGTGALMDALAAAHPDRLSVLHVAELRAGWLGKPHAMAVAARLAVEESAPEYLLFTDADIFFHPEIVRRSLAEAVATEADHFVTMPTTLIRTPGEGVVLKFLQIMGLWAVRPWRVADPRSRDAIGIGAFNLMRTEAYVRLGGFEATPMEVLEDLTLGRRVKRAGMRQRVAAAPGMVEVHWASTALGVLHGMTKNLFAIFRFRTVLLLLATGWLAAFCLTPYLLLITPGMRVQGLLAVAGIAGMAVLSSRRSLVSPWYGVAFPVAAAMFVYSLLRSMAVTLGSGGVTWRGTFYPLTELRREAAATERIIRDSALEHEA